MPPDAATTQWFPRGASKCNKARQKEAEEILERDNSLYL